MTTREQAIAEAGRVLAEGMRAAAAMSVEDAARAAYTPTGPSIEELERRIREQRARVMTSDARVATGAHTGVRPDRPAVSA